MQGFNFSGGIIMACFEPRDLQVTFNLISGQENRQVEDVRQ